MNPVFGGAVAMSTAVIDALLFTGRQWLALAAAPTFAMMALLGTVHGDASLDAFCSTAHGGPLLSSMGSMYLLMSTFHVAPWLKLLSSRLNVIRGA
jgi:hypothetical protein